MKVLVSSCLLGFGCRYDGEKRAVPEMMKKMENAEIVGLCPEYLFFRSAPREPVMLTASGEKILEGLGDMVNEAGDSFTNGFLEAADKLLGVAERFDPDICILKEKSPSCGLNRIFIHGKGWSAGCGIWAALLKKNLRAEFYNEDGDIC